MCRLPRIPGVRRPLQVLGSGLRWTTRGFGGFRNPESEIRNPKSGVRRQASGRRQQASGIRHQASGGRRQAAGGRRQAAGGKVRPGVKSAWPGRADGQLHGTQRGRKAGKVAVPNGRHARPGSLGDRFRPVLAARHVDSHACRRDWLRGLGPFLDAPAPPALRGGGQSGRSTRAVKQNALALPGQPAAGGKCAGGQRCRWSRGKG